MKNTIIKFVEIISAISFLLIGSSVPGFASDYEVIVVGFTPEAVAAAVTAARQGKATALIAEPVKVGGLWTYTCHNMLDNCYDPANVLLSQGIYKEFAQKLGVIWLNGDYNDGTFDITKAKSMFTSYLAGVDKPAKLTWIKRTSDPAVQSLYAAMDVNNPKLIAAVRVKKDDGMELTLSAPMFIDASESAELAYLAGVPYTIGRGNTKYIRGSSVGTVSKNDIYGDNYGPDELQMGSTLMFGLKNVNYSYTGTYGAVIAGDQFWGLANNKDFNDTSTIYGQKAKELNVALKGFNMMRQADGTSMVNGLVVFGVDGTDPVSVADGISRGRQAIPYAISFIKAKYPLLFPSTVTLATTDLNLEQGTGKNLYIRESRHIVGDYILGLEDELRGYKPFDTVAKGNYWIDIHPYKFEELQQYFDSKAGSPWPGSYYYYNGQKPPTYGIPIKCFYAREVDNLMVAGRTISAAPKAAGSARVLSPGIYGAESSAKIAAYCLNNNIKPYQVTDFSFLNTMAAPTLVAPKDKTNVYNVTSVTLDWSDVPGAAKYKFSVYDDTSLVWIINGAFVTTSTAAITITAGHNYKWYAKGIDAAGKEGPAGGAWYFYARTDKTAPTITGIVDSPDPFDPEAGQKAAISYTLGDNMSTTVGCALYIYNSSGSLVRTIGYYYQNTGARSTTWDGKNASGVMVPDGQYRYFFKVKDDAGNIYTSGNYYVTKK